LPLRGNNYLPEIIDLPIFCPYGAITTYLK
jgi:hypothetical protein